GLPAGSSQAAVVSIPGFRSPGCLQRRLGHPFVCLMWSQERNRSRSRSRSPLDGAVEEVRPGFHRQDAILDWSPLIDDFGPYPLRPRNLFPSTPDTVADSDASTVACCDEMKPTIGANTKKREIAALEAQDILDDHVHRTAFASTVLTEVKTLLHRPYSLELPVKALRRASLMLSEAEIQMEAGEYDPEFILSLSRRTTLNFDPSFDSNGSD
ncbi:unnamed protein product, partial [Durusdinium trenchii]